MASRPTMQEIAQELGLSRKTVSSVINGKARERGVSTATVERIQHHLNQRCFVPSRQAVELRKGETDAIGIIYAKHMYRHLMTAFHYLTDRLSGLGADLNVMVLNGEREIEGVTSLLSRGVSRVVWLQYTYYGPDHPCGGPAYRYLSNTDTIIYNFNFGKNADFERELADRGFHLVGVNRFDGWRKVAQFLHGLGHRAVAVSGGDAPYRPIFREEGLNVADIPLAPGHGIDLFGYKPEIAFVADRVYDLFRERKISAVFIADDELAAGVGHYLQQRGVRIPQDLTLVGFDNLPQSEFTFRPLTTVNIPVKGMVDLAIELLNSGGGGGERRHVFDLDLVLRKTHAPVAENWGREQ